MEQFFKFLKLFFKSLINTLWFFLTEQTFLPITEEGLKEFLPGILANEQVINVFLSNSSEINESLNGFKNSVGAVILLYICIANSYKILYLFRNIIILLIKIDKKYPVTMSFVKLILFNLLLFIFIIFYFYLNYS